MVNDSTPEPNSAQIDALLEFLPIFEQPGYSFGEWKKPEGQFPFYAFTADASRFYQALYDQGFVVSFDWPSWQETAVEYFRDPPRLAEADLDTLRKLLTLHVRKDRFAEGHLAEMLESRHITAILQRLSVLRAETQARVDGSS